jgi:hypothetical protein
MTYAILVDPSDDVAHRKGDGMCIHAVYNI